MARIALRHYLDVYGCDCGLRCSGRDRHGEQYLYLQHGCLLHDQSKRGLTALWIERSLWHDHGWTLANTDDSVFHCIEAKRPVSNHLGKIVSVPAIELGSWWLAGWGLLG